MGSDAKQNYKAKRTDALLLDPDDVVIVEEPDHPLYDPEKTALPISEEQVENVMMLGIIEPIIVQREKDKKEKWRIVVEDGRQRVKWLREANRRLRKARKPPKMIMAVWNKNDPTAVMISANSFRADESASSKAAKIKRYVDQGHTVQEAAVVAGVTTATIKNMLGLIEADPAVRKAVDKGLPASAAYKLTKLPKEKQKTEVAKLMANGAPPKGKKLQRAVDKARGQQLPSQRAKGGKEVKAMRDRALKAGMPVSAIAVFDWVLGDDNALSDYLGKEERAQAGGAA